MPLQVSQIITHVYDIGIENFTYITKKIYNNFAYL